MTPRIATFAAAIALAVFFAGCSRKTADTQKASHEGNSNQPPAIASEVPKMKQTDTEGLNYEGAKNDNATITIEEQNTDFLVNCRMDGVKKIVKKGEPITFALKPDGTATNFEFSFRFSSKKGTYKVVVSPVDGFPDDERPMTFKQQGSTAVIIDYGFIGR
jgi:ABC-type Fe3+-hydroxamate transport system substrate-binding protein